MQYTATFQIRLATSFSLSMFYFFIQCRPSMQHITANFVLAHLDSTLMHSDVSVGASNSNFALAHSSLTLQHASVSAPWQSNVLRASFSAFLIAGVSFCFHQCQGLHRHHRQHYHLQHYHLHSLHHQFHPPVHHQIEDHAASQHTLISPDVDAFVLQMQKAFATRGKSSILILVNVNVLAMDLSAMNCKGSIHAHVNVSVQKWR